MITILIADDHTLVRETWITLLESHEGFKVIAQCGTGEEAVQLAKELRPQIVIMDINMPGINGIEATKLIRRFAPGSKVLGVSLHTQPTYARKMIQEGAMGYVTKSSTREEMIHAITEILDGKKYICDEIKNIVSEQLLMESSDKIGVEALSSRELQIINELKKGLSSKEIAAKLFISIKTVEVHRYNILRKLKLKNTASLINFINSHPQLNT